MWVDHKAVLPAHFLYQLLNQMLSELSAVQTFIQQTRTYEHDMSWKTTYWFDRNMLQLSVF